MFRSYSATSWFGLGLTLPGRQLMSLEGKKLYKLSCVQKLKAVFLFLLAFLNTLLAVDYVTPASLERTLFPLSTDLRCDTDLAPAKRALTYVQHLLCTC